MASRIYFDNAATTAIDPIVLEAMMPFFTNHFGNPSSIYSYGRETRNAIEKSRKSVAEILSAHPSEIFFTSGGTESSNTAINAAIRDLGCTRIITAKIEHHATLHTCVFLAHKYNIPIEYVSLLPDGHIDLIDLEKKLAGSTNKTLISLMHANNEIGNITDIDQVGQLAKKYQAVFHADTVQTVGHFPINLHTTQVDFITGSAHKFHGPKGVGILYINSSTQIPPLIHGGGQERNMRAGTENIYGIVGFAKALELATTNHQTDRNYIASIKSYLQDSLIEKVSGVTFNGDQAGNALYTVLNVGFPKNEKSEMLLLNLDVNNICVSGGSACSSGADQGSHVIQAIGNNEKMNVRFSFSKLNTKEEVDVLMNLLIGLV